MVINESALYNGSLWCAYELKDVSGNYIESLRLFMRKESQKSKFYCPVCKEPLILCAGPIMEPHFRHHEDSECDQGVVYKSGSYARIQRMLYHLVQRSFPGALTEFHKKVDQDLCAPLFISEGEHRLAIEYISSDWKLEEWEAKHATYKEHGIMDVWILSNFHRPHDKITTFEYLLTSASPVLKVLNASEDTLYLKERCQTGRLQEMLLLVFGYEFSHLTLDWDGEFICDFPKRRDKELLKVYQEDQQIQQEEIERIQLQAAKRREEIHRRQLEKSMQLEPSCLIEEEITSESRNVRRRNAGSGSITKNTMKMTAIGEWWELPELRGEDWQIRRGNNSRFLYLRSVNKELLDIESPLNRDAYIAQVLDILEKKLSAVLWR